MTGTNVSQEGNLAGVLGARSWRISQSLRPLFEIHRASEFHRMVKLWWPLLLLVHAGLGVLGAVALWHLPMGFDEWRYVLITVFGASVIGISTYMTLKPRWLVTRDQWLPWSAFLILGSIADGVVHHPNPAFVQFSLILSPVVAMVYLWALRPSLLAAIKFSGLNIMLMVLVAMKGHSLVVTHFVVQMTLVCLVGLFCIFVRDESDRDHFLKAVYLYQAETLLKNINRGLDDLAHRDALTELPNRRALDDVLYRECLRAARSRSHLAVMLIDIDYFKRFNDLHGHLHGDACLRTVAQTLQSCLQRPADFVARFGGEEFVVLLPGTDLRGAREVASRLVRHVDDLGLAHENSDVAAHVTVSVGGVVVKGHSSIKPSRLLQLADELLYQVKLQGRHGSIVRLIG